MCMPAVTACEGQGLHSPGISFAPLSSPATPFFPHKLKLLLAVFDEDATLLIIIPNVPNVTALLQ